MNAHALLQHLRTRGVEVEERDGRLRVVGPREALPRATVEALRAAKPDLLAALRREAVEALLDTVVVDPETGLPDLPADEPATARQVERLRELAAHPAFGDHRTRVREIVEEALDRGLSQLGAYGLLGELGRRIAEREERGSP